MREFEQMFRYFVHILLKSFSEESGCINSENVQNKRIILKGTSVEDTCL